jgi:hypothetical protein
MKLVQGNKTFELNSDHILITEKNEQSDSKYSIPYEKIGNEIISYVHFHHDYSRIWLACLLGSIIGILVYLFDATEKVELVLVLLPCIAFVVFSYINIKTKWNTIEVELIEEQSTQLIFIENLPTQMEFEEFIKQLMSKSKDYLLNKYK